MNVNPGQNLNQILKPNERQKLLNPINELAMLRPGLHLKYDYSPNLAKKLRHSCKINLNGRCFTGLGGNVTTAKYRCVYQVLEAFHPEVYKKCLPKNHSKRKIETFKRTINTHSVATNVTSTNLYKSCNKENENTPNPMRELLKLRPDLKCVESMHPNNPPKSKHSCEIIIDDKSYKRFRSNIYRAKKECAIRVLKTLYPEVHQTYKEKTAAAVAVNSNNEKKSTNYHQMVEKTAVDGLLKNEETQNMICPINELLKLLPSIEFKQIVVSTNEQITWYSCEVMIDNVSFKKLRSDIDSAKRDCAIQVLRTLYPEVYEVYKEKKLKEIKNAEKQSTDESASLTLNDIRFDKIEAAVDLIPETVNITNEANSEDTNEKDEILALKQAYDSQMLNDNDIEAAKPQTIVNQIAKEVVEKALLSKDETAKVIGVVTKPLVDDVTMNHGQNLNEATSKKPAEEARRVNLKRTYGSNDEVTSSKKKISSLSSCRNKLNEALEGRIRLKQPGVIRQKEAKKISVNEVTIKREATEETTRSIVVFDELKQLISSINSSIKIESIQKLIEEQLRNNSELSHSNANLLITLYKSTNHIWPVHGRNPELVQLNILSLLFDYLNKHRIHPELIADYIIALSDAIKAKTTNINLIQDLIHRLNKLVTIIKINEFKEIIYHENLLPVLLDILKKKRISSETNECCVDLLLKLNDNIMVRGYLRRNQDILVNGNNIQF